MPSRASISVATIRRPSPMAAAEASRDLLKLLETLPDRHRLPILLVKLEGKSVAEAALHLGMSESAVKIGIHRGLKLLARVARDSE